MNRIEMIQAYMDTLIQNKAPKEYKGASYIHLFSVSQFCSLLAFKRGLNVELAAISGLLHDIYSYQTGDFFDHAHLGSIEARKVLEQFQIFEQEEIEFITKSIYYHSDKSEIHGRYAEVLKNADVLAHCLFDPTKIVSDYEKERYHKLKIELGLGGIEK